MSFGFCRSPTIYIAFCTKNIFVPEEGPIERVYFKYFGPSKLDHYSMIKELLNFDMEQSIIRFYRYAGMDFFSYLASDQKKSSDNTSKAQIP